MAGETDPSPPPPDAPTLADLLAAVAAGPAALMTARTAARYLDMGVEKFRRLVREGRLPRPVGFRGPGEREDLLWRRRDLDAKVNALKRKEK